MRKILEPISKWMMTLDDPYLWTEVGRPKTEDVSCPYDVSYYPWLINAYMQYNTLLGARDKPNHDSKTSDSGLPSFSPAYRANHCRNNFEMTFTKFGANMFTKRLIDYSNPFSAGNRFRNRRFDLFRAMILKLGLTEVKILDVGGTVSFWQNRDIDDLPIQVTIVNLHAEESNDNRIRCVIGNALDMAEFSEKEFDVVFSNSVIEHLFSFENQVKMANEVRRIGKHYFVQTPNKYFLIEPHFVLPLFQFYPKWLQYFVLSKTRLSKGYKRSHLAAVKVVDEIKLLSLKKFKRLFPDAEIYQEKIFGLTKSYIAHNFR